MMLVSSATKSLSEPDRQRLCMTLLGLNVVQICLAVSGFALGGYISLSLNSKAHLVRRYSLKPIGGALSGCSIALFALHCLGAKASNDCAYLRTRHRFRNKLFLIVLGYAVASAALLAVSVLCLVQYSKLKPALNHGLLGAMRLYPKDRTLKRDIDEIQMEYGCCGSSNYSDWFKVKWMPENSLPHEKDRIFMYGRRDYLHSVPFSCCDPSSAAPCFHRLVDTERGEYRYPNHGFFKRGCTAMLLEVLQEFILAAALLVLVPFLMEISIAVQTRYLQTSLDDCKRKRNPCGTGNCWLFKRSPYEADLQSRSQTDLEDPLSLLSSSSSEEEESSPPFHIAPNEKDYSDELDQFSTPPPTKSTGRVRNKTDGVSSSRGGNEDDDRKQSLLKQMKRPFDNSRPKRYSL